MGSEKEGWYGAPFAKERHDFACLKSRIPPYGDYAVAVNDWGESIKETTQRLGVKAFVCFVDCK
ncbi:MAG: hypothetical protein EB075_13060 [Bacteroidetes bacterium]|nr:hypothetical protein [Bacteroidota bacterium]